MFDFLYCWYENDRGENLRGGLITDYWINRLIEPARLLSFRVRLWIARKLIPKYFGHPCPKCNHVILLKEWKAL